MGIFDKKDDKPESKPDFSNVRSGGSSTAPEASQPTGATGSERTYIVVEGDSLSKIAKREYGDATVQMRLMKYGRDHELDADALGVQIMADAGYDPRALMNVMTILAKASSGSRQPEFFSTHPDPGNRQERIRQQIATKFPEGVPGRLTLGRRVAVP
jgi:predicted Zn-dependent protease